MVFFKIFMGAWDHTPMKICKKYILLEYVFFKIFTGVWDHTHMKIIKKSILLNGVWVYSMGKKRDVFAK